MQCEFNSFEQDKTYSEVSLTSHTRETRKKFQSKFARIRASMAKILVKNILLANILANIFITDKFLALCYNC